MFSLTQVLPAVALIIFYVYRRFQSRISIISQLRGPPSSSWIYGNWYEFLDASAAQLDFQWQSMYGDIIRLSAPFGEDRLLISDPKALQYIYHTSSYYFPKATGRRAIARVITGPGLANVEGDDHRRARKVMLPGFGGMEARSHLPIFFGTASKLAQKWQDLINTNDNQTSVIDVPSWISRATLDAIGEAAFDYHFGALDNLENELSRAYTNVFVDTFGQPTRASAIGVAIVDSFIPEALMDFVLRRLPISRFSHGIKTRRLSEMTSKQLIEEKTKSLLDGSGRRDVMTLLLKANNSENPATRLEEYELLAQMNVIILAGHETTANTLSFTLLELCKNPKIQTKLRQEIRSMGKTDGFTVSDLEGMPYLTGVVKESLRFHPIVYNGSRVAVRDDVLPLLNPITTVTGKVLAELPIRKGTNIVSSIAAYNRNKTTFGEDADVYRPERWIGEKAPKSDISLGVYGSLLTFGGGARSCIGWRFAVLEIQAFLIELVGKFEFEFTPQAGADDFRREACLLMVPTLKKERSKGSQLPLKIRMVRDSE